MSGCCCCCWRRCYWWWWWKREKANYFGMFLLILKKCSWTFTRKIEQSVLNIKHQNMFFLFFSYLLCVRLSECLCILTIRAVSLKQLSYDARKKRTYLRTCAPNKDSNQPVHSRSLISVFVVRMKKLCILGYPNCGQWRLDCANAQADLNLR